MALTFRNTKGASLTHTELDNNFREFYYSASYDGSGLYLYKSQSLNNVTNLPFQAPVGYDYYVQVKAGDAPSGSDALFTGSKNFRFDYRQNVLDVTGSQNITGNLVVGGTVTAEEFITEYSTVAVSTIYKSGSSKFGDTSDDNHAFTGSLEIVGRFEVTGPTTQSGNIIVTGNTTQTGNIDLTGDITQTGNIDLTGDITQTGNIDLTGNTTQTGNISLTGEVTQSGNYKHTGDTNHIGSTVQIGNVAHSGNVTRTGNTIQTGTVSNTGDISITGSLTVTGRVIAEEYHTEFVSSSIIFNSGSTLFGNSQDDTHVFTGSLLVTNGITGSTDFNTLVNKPTLLSSSAQIASDISGSINSLTSSFFTSASVVLNTITFTKGNGSTANIQISTGSGGAGIASILEDTTPQLGGNLDLNSNNISGSGNINTVGSLTLTGNITAAQITGSTLNTSGTITAGGAITAGGDVTAFFSSDERLKDNITPIEGALEKVNQIGGYGFDWNSNSEHSGHDVGVIAQEIEKVLPEVVTTRDNGYKAVRYEKIVALLIQAVKEQQLQIDELKSKL